jgi:hypothetical protein
MRRVTVYAERLATVLGLPPQLINALQKAGLTHDLNDMAYASDAVKYGSAKRARELLEKYLGVKKDVPLSAIKSFIKDKPAAYRPLIDSEKEFYSRAIAFILDRERITGDERTLLRSVMLIELCHEIFALETLERAGIEPHPVIEWLIMHHNSYIVADDEYGDMERLARSINVLPDELVLALETLILADVFENFANKKRSESRGREVAGLVSALDVVRGKAVRHGMRFSAEIFEGFKTLLKMSDNVFMAALIDGRGETSVDMIKEAVDYDIFNRPDAEPLPDSGRAIYWSQRPSDTVWNGKVEDLPQWSRQLPEYGTIAQIAPYRRFHVQYVCDLAQKLLLPMNDTDVDYLYFIDILSEAKKIPADNRSARQDYINGLMYVRKVFNSLPETYQRIFWLELAFHDFGYAKPGQFITLGHEDASVEVLKDSIIPREGLARRFSADELEMALLVVGEHTMLGNSRDGEYVPLLFSEDALSYEMRLIFALHNIFDAMGYASRTEKGYAVANNLDLQQLQEIISIIKDPAVLTGDYFKYRLQTLAREYREKILSDDEVAILGECEKIIFAEDIDMHHRLLGRLMNIHSSYGMIKAAVRAPGEQRTKFMRCLKLLRLFSFIVEYERPGTDALVRLSTDTEQLERDFHINDGSDNYVRLLASFAVFLDAIPDRMSHQEFSQGMRDDPMPEYNGLMWHETTDGFLQVDFSKLFQEWLDSPSTPNIKNGNFECLKAA